MKQKLFLSIIAIGFSVLSVSAQTEEKLFVNAGNAEHIIIANDMNVVLMPATGSDRSISLDANASAKLDLKLSKNAMTISSLRLTRKEKLTIYLYVNNIKTITAGYNTTIKTAGVLNSPRLELYVDGEATAHLKTKGNIKVFSLNDAKIKVKYISENLLAGTDHDRIR